MLTIVRIKDLMFFYGVSERTAVRRKRVILDSLGKTDSNILYALDLARYEKRPMSDIKDALRAAR